MGERVSEVRREVLAENILRLSTERCSFTYRRLKPGTVLMEIAGDDKGQFGAATMDEINSEFERFGVITLFIDTQKAIGPATVVMESWTAFFAANSKKFRTISILVLPESKLLNLTVSIIRHLSGIGAQFQIFDDPARYRAAVKREFPSYEG